MNYFKSTFPIFSPSREAISSQWWSGWISFSIKVCKGTWSCTNEHNKPRLFLEFTLTPVSFRFSEKLDYDNMSRDIQTCKWRLKWTRIFWYGFLFSLSFPIIINFSLINSDMYTSLLSSETCVFVFVFALSFCFFCFSFISILPVRAGDFISKIELPFHLIQPILSALAAAQDEMKRARAFKLTVTVIDRWREIFDSQELPSLFWRVCHFRFESLEQLSTWRPLVRSNE